MLTKLSVFSFSLAMGAEKFGPEHCVSVSRNAETGTCVLETNCGKLNLDNVEFAFTCKRPGVTQKHSFGKGGFDAAERFDTSVQCDVCGLPAEVTLSLKKASHHEFLKPMQVSDDEADTTATNTTNTTATDTATTTTATTTFATVSYGPQNCIETWLKPDSASGNANANVTDGEAGVCYVRTKCSTIDTTVFQEYPIGVIASDKDGVPVRHLFGANSFDKSEEFNTLIRATACYGMDQTAEAITLENEIKALSRVVYGVKKDVAMLKGDVNASETLLLNEHKRYEQLAQNSNKEQRRVERERREDSEAEEEEDAPAEEPQKKVEAPKPKAHHHGHGFFGDEDE